MLPLLGNVRHGDREGQRDRIADVSPTVTDLNTSICNCSARATISSPNADTETSHRYKLKSDTAHVCATLHKLAGSVTRVADRDGAASAMQEK